MLAEIAQAVAGQVMRRLADEHLAAVAGSRDPRRAVDVDADVTLLRDERFAGVEAHSDTERAVLERPLGVGRSTQRVGRAREGDKERVALRVDLDAAVSGEGVAQDPTVLSENAGVGVAELVKEPRRALDVGEEEGDGAGRELTHRDRRIARAVRSG